MTHSASQTASTQTEIQLTNRQLASFGVGSIASAMFNAVPALVLLYFLTNSLGVSPAWAGAAMLFPKLWDVVTDPLMGFISDRTNSRWGRRRPWMFIGAITLPLAFYQVFAVPEFASWQGSYYWVMSWYIVAAACFTVYVVPYVSMPAEMTNSYHERTRILAWRMGFVVVGILVGGALAPLFIKLGGGGRAGHQLMGAGLGLIMFVVMVFTVVTSAKLPRRKWQKADAAGFQAFKIAFANRPFKVLMFSYMLMMVAGNCLMAAVPFYVAHILGQGGEFITVLFLCHLVPSLLFIPFWNAFSKRMGKNKGLLAGATIYGIGSTALFFIGATPPMWLVLLVITLMGIGMGAIQLFPFAMVPDVIAVDRRKSGMNREGLFMGVWIANEKIGIACGAFLAAMVLEWAGFIEGTSTQPSAAIYGVQMAMGLVPALIMFLSMAVLKGYSLDRELLRHVQSKPA